jgi:hypothetical protein
LPAGLKNDMGRTIAAAPTAVAPETPVIAMASDAIRVAPE